MNPLVRLNDAQEGPIRFGTKEAAPGWFNCGPAALCAALGMTPEEIRPHLLDFESKGYTNPTLMMDILRGLGVDFRMLMRNDEPGARAVYSRLGLIRIQWGGKWTRPGVPMRVRYRKTHWIAVRRIGFIEQAFDVNYVEHGGWMPRRIWETRMAPWLIINMGEDGYDGTSWPTHCIAVGDCSVLRKERR